MPRRITNLFLRCCLTGLLVLHFGASHAQSYAVQNVDVYDVASGNVVIDQHILIQDGLIIRIDAESLTDLPDGTVLVSGTGLTILPGLCDAHAHITKADFGSFLANGVTSVRELNGSIDHLKLRDSITRSEVLGPRLLVSSPLISGKPIDFRHVTVENPEQAVSVAEQFAAEGYDYLKIYDDLSAESYSTLAEASRQFGIPLVGHISAAVGLSGVLSANQAIEHNEKIVVDVLGSRFKNVVALDDAAQRIADAGVAVTPTLAVHEFLSLRRSTVVRDRLQSPEMQFVDSDITLWWRSMFPSEAPDPKIGLDSNQSAFLNAQRYLLKQLQERRVPILAGTDTPNPLMIAGFSIHDELDALSRAGMTNAASIRAATKTPGEELPWLLPIGQVKVGFAADLLLVKGNPAEDLSVLRKPAGVFANGVWLNKKQLTELQESARRK